MILSEGKYYLYCHIRIDKNQPFYIGIGTKKNGRSFSSVYSRATEKSNRNKHWKNVILITDYKIKILLESDDYSFIQKKEIEFIKLYGRIDLKTGILTNWTRGGAGNYELNPISYQRIVNSKIGQKGYWTGKKRSLETNKKISEGNKGKKLTKEHKENLSKSKIFPVIILDSKGKFLKEVQNNKIASLETGVNIKKICAYLNGTIKTSKICNFIFIKKKDYDPTKIYLSKNYFSNWVSIIQKTLNNEFIKEWENATLAGRELKINNKNITSVARGKRNTAGGYKWEYKNYELSYENKKRIKKD